MLAVAAKILDAGRKLAEANDSPGALTRGKFCVTECPYSVTYDLRIAPAMAALQPAHDFPRVFIESGVYDGIHVYNSSKVYRKDKPTESSRK